jgi:hypothetical protein
LLLLSAHRSRRHQPSSLLPESPTPSPPPGSRDDDFSASATPPYHLHLAPSRRRGLNSALSHPPPRRSPARSSDASALSGAIGLPMSSPNENGKCRVRATPGMGSPVAFFVAPCPASTLFSLSAAGFSLHILESHGNRLRQCGFAVPCGYTDCAGSATVAIAILSNPPLPCFSRAPQPVSDQRNISANCPPSSSQITTSYYRLAQIEPRGVSQQKRQQPPSLYLPLVLRVAVEPTALLPGPGLGAP